MPQIAPPTAATRVARHAAIRRASALARRQMAVIDRDSRVDLTRIYRQAVSELSQQVAASAPTGTVALESLQSLLQQAERTLDRLSAGRDSLLTNSLNNAATAGVGALASDAGRINASLNAIAHDAVRVTRDFIANDGLQLSDRVWRTDNHTRKTVKEAIEQAVIQGHSAAKAAENLLINGRSVPPGLRTKLNIANPKGITQGVKSGLMKDPGAPLPNALRLFRTEINRAHGEAYMGAALAHDDVIGTRFLLSPNHPRPDICDLHASVNRYGLGPGVYPQNKSPWPAHPSTLSFVEVVFIDEITKEDQQGKEGRIDWLKQQSQELQEQILSSRKKRMALERGLLKEGQINTPWRVLKKRYTSRGIDTSQWATGDYPATAAARPASPRAPVSAALDVRGQKRAVAQTLEAIDRVHDDGDLPTIPILSSRSRRTHGTYWASRRLGQVKAEKIVISQHGGHKSLTTAHEVGHFLDQQAIGDAGKFASEYHPAMDEWWQAVQKTNAYRQQQKLAVGPSSVAIDGTGYRVQKKHLKYLLQRKELWARSYAQYIAEKGKSSVMAGELAEQLSREANAKLSYHHQWQTADFTGISSAIDRLMRELGWAK